MIQAEILEELQTKKGVKVEVRKNTDGYSLSWTYMDKSTCLDAGETTPTEYKFPTAKHRRRFKRITDVQIVYDLFKAVKRKSRWSGLYFNDVSSIVYQNLKKVYGDDAVKYYDTQYID